MENKIIGKNHTYRVFKNGTLEKLRKDGSWHSCKATKHSAGYLRFCIDGKPAYAHVVVAESFIPKPKGKVEVDHISGNKADNRIENLRWVSHQRNIELARKRVGNWSVVPTRSVVRNDGKKFDSISDAARFHGIQYSTFAPALIRSIKNDWNCYGFRWSY